MGDNEISDKKWLRLPPWGKKVLIVAGIVGPLGTAVTASVSTYYKVKAAKSQAADAKKKTTDSYKSLAPVLKEVKEILNEGMAFVNELDEVVAGLEKENDNFRDRIVRLETYIEILSKNHNNPELPDEPHDHSHEEPLPFHSAKPRGKIRKATRFIPETMDKAQDYQQQRIEMDCPPDDPLCGI